MITLMGWVPFCMRSPKSLAKSLADFFCLPGLPQLNIELEHGGEIFVECIPAS